jgi:malonyl-CoA O-methyltransferase
MQERLDFIKCQPASWIHWEPVCGGLQAHALLTQRYPNASATLFETSTERARSVDQKLALPWWQLQRWRQPRPKVVTQMACSAQMLWSNMSLHMTDNPQALMAQWHKALEVDGFLMFSCLGPDTLRELRSLYQAMNWPAPSHEFTDMHDWGDMLVAAGFAEPVMDMERITLTFESPQRLLQELRGLGRNLHVDRFGGLRGRAWHQQLMQALGNAPLQLNFEVVYGHAFKPASRHTVSEHQEISLAEMRAELARGKSNR